MAMLSIFAGPTDISSRDQIARSERKIFEWNCGAVAWTPNSGLNGALFDGGLVSDCTVKGTKGTGFPTLQDFVVRKVTSESRVNAGPNSETYVGLPGVKYDVTLTIKSSQGDVELRQDVHIATDNVNRLVFDSFSTDVSGTGYAEYLKRLDVTIDVIKTAKAGTYTIHVGNATQIEKPWFAPEGMFLEKIKPAMEQKFREIRDQVVPQIADNL
jgi:hypothetical protein